MRVFDVVSCDDGVEWSLLAGSATTLCIPPSPLFSPQARQLLQFAALHALSTHLQADEVLAPAALLPQVSRVLLQTEEAQASKYLEAVAAALASQMNASLLMVDGMLLASLASTTFEAPPEAFLAVFSGTAAAGASGRAALKLQLAWLALRDALFALERPTGVCRGEPAGMWTACGLTGRQAAGSHRAGPTHPSISDCHSPTPPHPPTRLPWCSCVHPQR